MEKENDLLIRRVEKIIPSKKDLETLLKKRKIKLYLGIDPTAKRLHLGHTVPLRKLMDFANLGHDAYLVFGTGTVLVGDPSQRESKRKLIKESEIEKNIVNWKKQVEKIVDFNKVKVVKNGDWLTPLKLKDIIKIASNISAIQLFKRDMFTKRLQRNDTVWYHETMYPLLQGYDSVHLDVDLEIGGTDQEFNMLIGRELMRKMKNKEKYVIETDMILGTDGKQMSKTSGNCVFLDDTPEDMYIKLMGILDNQIVSYFKLVTDLPLSRIKEIESSLQSNKLHPMDAKKELALTVVTQFYAEEEAKKAEDNFEKSFQKKEPEFKIEVNLEKTLSLTIAPYTSKKSVSEAKRLISQGSVDVNAKTIKDPLFILKENDEIKVGKKIFLKVKK